MSPPLLGPHDPIVILGAGPCGLGAARRLAEWGHEEWVVLEASDCPGGLARSFVDAAGFTWDLGAHVQFSHYEYFDRAMDEALAADQWLPRVRDTWVRLGDADVPFPFQYHLHRLPAATRDACVVALREAASRPPSPAPDFRQWILSRFGAGIAEAFLLPYNEKIWARDPAELSVAWTADRVAPVDLSRVEHGLATGADAPDWGPNHRFRYPRHGGAGAVWKQLGERLGPRLRLGSRAQALDLERKRLRLAGGEEVEYAALISTVPLDRLAGMTGDPAWADAAGPLAYTTVDVFGAALRGPAPSELAGRTWMYHPGPEAPFYRSTMMSELSPDNVPEAPGDWSLLLEVASAAGAESPVEVLTEAVRRGLRATGLQGDSDLDHLWHRRLPYGYPVPTLGRDAALQRLLLELASHGVLSRGRFGAWKYEVSNQDHSFMQGVEAVDRLRRGDREPTLETPGLVNAGARCPPPRLPT